MAERLKLRVRLATSPMNSVVEDLETGKRLGFRAITVRQALREGTVVTIEFPVGNTHVVETDIIEEAV